jgi:acyl carrier protein
MTTDTLATLLTLIHEQHHLDVSSVTRETSLADVGLDSLAVAELLFSIEDTFKISLGEVAHDALPSTVGEVVAMIDAHQSERLSISS